MYDYRIKAPRGSADADAPATITNWDTPGAYTFEAFEYHATKAITPQDTHALLTDAMLHITTSNGILASLVQMALQHVNQPVDSNNICNEIGFILHYLNQIAIASGTTLEIAARNINARMKDLHNV